MINLSNDLRQFVTQSVLTSGGHFSSNLGVIELTVALHHTLNFPSDGIVWDVGHQSYPHKVLTGRGDLLHTIRSFQGLSGFPKREESPFDIFGTGHSSTAISAAMGMAAAAKIKSKSQDTSPNTSQPTFVAVVGDGALTAGLSYEALNNLFESDLNVMIVLNDNHMGIDPNTGALNTRLQTAPEKVKAWFEWFGLNYQGPIDGHNLEELLPAIQHSYHQTGPRLIHIKTNHVVAGTCSANGDGKTHIPLADNCNAHVPRLPSYFRFGFNGSKRFISFCAWAFCSAVALFMASKVAHTK